MRVQYGTAVFLSLIHISGNICQASFWINPQSALVAFLMVNMFCCVYINMMPVSYTHLDVYKRQLLMVLDAQSESVRHYSKRLMCPVTGLSYREPAPHNFCLLYTSRCV